MICWLLVAACMAFIFAMSAKQASDSSRISGGLIERFLDFVSPDFRSGDAAYRLERIEALQNIVRKTAHFTIYALLGVLASQALFCHTESVKTAALVAFAVCLLYAASDEVHQLFVPGRSGEVRDVCIDSLGAALGITLSCLVTRLVMSRKRRKSEDPAV